jgi:hypothetical protein
MDAYSASFCCTAIVRLCSLLDMPRLHRTVTLGKVLRLFIYGTEEMSLKEIVLPGLCTTSSQYIDKKGKMQAGELASPVTEYLNSRK